MTVRPEINVEMENLVAVISKLAIEGERPVIHKVPTEGLGDGLPHEVPVLVAPTRAGGGVQPLKAIIEAYRQRPERRRGTAVTTTLSSFVDLVNRHKDADSAVFARTTLPDPMLTAVIDYHDAQDDVGSALPRHCQHRVTYAFPLTAEFKAWLAMDGKPMSQEAFATFLEEHAAELAVPLDIERTDFERLFKDRFALPSDLIAFARELEVYVGAQVKSAARLKSGERQAVFVTEHTNSKGEAIDIPGLFMVAVEPFLDSRVIRIPARLRYRPTSDGIVWSYQLYRADFWLRAQVQADLAHVAENTGLPTYEGAPEA